MNPETRETPALVGASGSAKCRWIISSNIGGRYCECSQPATKRDPECGQTLCDEHAEDYEEVFGEVLHTLSPNSALNDGQSQYPGSNPPA